MIKKVQIYATSCTDPYENLAVENNLLDTVGEETLILYLWQNQKTVVIGKNQNPWAECNCRLLKQEGGKLARRLSGGGAVFHDLGNLNFTFLCREEEYDPDRHREILLNACKRAGIQAERSGRNDLLAEGRKFSGNAFYHAGGRAYQHGTLLIEADLEMMQRYLTPAKTKLEAKGIKSVRSRVVNLRELAPDLTSEKMGVYLKEALEDVCGLKAELLPPIDREQLKPTIARYADWDFLYGTPLPLSMICEARFSWGGMQIQLEIKGGIIQKCRVYTDAMDWSLAEQIEGALLQKRFAKEDLETALRSVPYKDDVLNLLL